MQLRRIGKWGYMALGITDVLVLVLVSRLAAVYGEIIRKTVMCSAVTCFTLQADYC